ncbi:MAG TPA: polysaccharide lyase family 7 protein [Opitutaceae bacterium]|nr:polysaccharide lyase family 7 protein [Opitutaceae bacterium]
MKKSVFALVLLAAAGGLAPSRADAPASPAAETPAGDLYSGFVRQPLKVEVQHPYDLPEEARYSYDKATDTHDLWVLESDKPHLPPPNKTEARTELRFKDDNYQPGSGLHMMDCDMYIVPGTFACISQVFGTGPMCIIVVDTNGRIYDLRTNVTIAEHMAGKWFHWTVVHDPSAVGLGAIKVYVDGKLADGQVGGKKEASYYFKIGVYSRKGSNRNEVKVRNLRYLIKPPAEK